MGGPADTDMRGADGSAEVAAAAAASEPVAEPAEPLPLGLAVIADTALRYAPNRAAFATGSFGDVCRATYRGHQVIVKELCGTFDAKTRDQIRAEAEQLAKPHHRNLNRLVALVTEPTRCAFVTEFAPCGNLRQLLESSPALPWHVRCTLAQGLVAGMATLHAARPALMHLNMKPENVLLVREADGSLVAKVADCGVTRVCCSAIEYEVLDEMVDVRYSDPRLCRGNAPTADMDVWAVGMTLFFLFTGVDPFCPHEPADEATVAKVLDDSEAGVRPAFPVAKVGGGGVAGAPAVSEPVQEAIEACWAEVPASRPTLRKLRTLLSRAIKRR